MLQNILSKSIPHISEVVPVSGGSINNSYRIKTKENIYFCKTNSATAFPLLFQKEKWGLEFLQKQQVIKVPEVVDCFTDEDKQVLLLEWIEQGNTTKKFWKKFGEQLAQLHSRSIDSFGFEENNFMGSVVQENPYSKSWIYFFENYRLLPLMKKCNDKNLLPASVLDQLYKLIELLPHIYDDAPPALLHGDLWSGNFMCSSKEELVLIDPAVYFGHRSIDIGMTNLFSGFDKDFYDAYHHYFPYSTQFEQQCQISNLYPLLIHLLLFGSSYLASIKKILKESV